MDNTYPVTLNGLSVGTVSVEKLGLYYRFSCKCRLDGKDLFSLYANQENLGTLIPDGDCFCLTTRIPQKHFPEREIVFYLLSKNSRQTVRQIKVCSEEPFKYLDQLQDATFSSTQQGPVIFLTVKNSHPEEERCPCSS